MGDVEFGRFGGWRVVQRVPDALLRHIVPEEDMRDHTLTLECWCQPRHDDECEVIIIHNSMDGREMFERGQRRVS